MPVILLFIQRILRLLRLTAIAQAWRKIPKKYRDILVQLAVVVIVVSVIAFFGFNYYQNITQRNIGIGFGFLNDTAGFSISQTLIEYEESDTFARTFLIGLLNTLLASSIGIVLATVLGFIWGLMRLSHNWLVAKTALGIIEFLRNIPPLLHVFFWYQVFFLRILPPLDSSWRIGNSIFINIRGITIPEFIANAPQATVFWLIIILTIAALIILTIYNQREVEKGRHHKLAPMRIAIIAIPILYVIIFQPFTLVLPELGRFRFTRGQTLLPELFSIIIALATYTATYIAEIVRNSIIGVPKGQVEASLSLGFSRSQQLRLIIIPQAMQTMIPPVTNQYLNLIKNTSLGLAIAYPELTAVFAGTALNQSGRALEIMLIVMLTYLSISLFTSMLMNIYNKNIVNKKGKAIDIENTDSLEIFS